jgi:hypothetical protein
MRDPLTIEQARAKRFRRWAGEPKGTPFSEGDCAAEVPDGGRSPLFHQCRRSAVTGPGGLYCKQHAAAIQPPQDDED